MNAVTQNLIVGLLLTILCSVLAVTLLLVLLVRKIRKHQNLLLQDEPIAVAEKPGPVITLPRLTAIRRPECWLAIRNREIPAVQSGLGLHDVRSCTWADGLAGGLEQSIFIAPPVNGWVLVIGTGLPNPCEDEDAAYRFMVELSRKVGHVQLFCASTVLNRHAWVRAQLGRITRAYAWSAGKTLWNQGCFTDAEQALGMQCLEYTEESEAPAFGAADDVGNTEKVPLLAARWSLDPGELDEAFVERARGVAGEPTRIF